MPAELWDSAVSLARAHGVWLVAQALELNYMNLKKRVGRTPKHGRGGAARRSTGFVEMDGAQLVGRAEPTGTVVELLGADGEKLMIRLTDSESLDVVGLSDSFWRRRT